ncbi:RNA recognition motif domain-containing protein [Rhizosphaericola mali]|uniref:RNA-binding protein n=1 Tax=Rhizosphaericola mali TaxID=2545455 RepID=A0A5P2GEB7_9BACT|nr:RNA-binding protein [Rhizosphaericola mali]QES89951.1 RNA-binding protein [Rhizosphaericola mali]
MKLFVAGLPRDFDDVDFKEMFELYGTVASAKVIMDRATQKSKGFGFLEMPVDTEANSVITTLNGVKMAGKPLVIKEATEQASAPQGPRQGGFRPQGPRQGGGGNYNRPNGRSQNRY